MGYRRIEGKTEGEGFGREGWEQVVWQGRGQLEEVSRAGGGKEEPVSTRTVLGEEKGVGLWPTLNAWPVLWCSMPQSIPQILVSSVHLPDGKIKLRDLGDLHAAPEQLILEPVPLITIPSSPPSQPLVLDGKADK